MKIVPLMQIDHPIGILVADKLPEFLAQYAMRLGCHLGLRELPVEITA